MVKALFGIPNILKQAASSPFQNIRYFSANMHKAPAAMVTKMESVIINTPRDPCTLSNYNNFKTTHTSADLHIDFKAKKLSGHVTLLLKSTTNAESKEILLDTR